MLRPLLNRVLVRRHKKDKSDGGILLPDTAQKKLFRGEVLAVGPGKSTDEGVLIPVCPVRGTGEDGFPVAGVKVGDVVIFGEWSGHEVEVDGEKDKLVVLEQDDLLLVEEPTAPVAV